MLFDTPIYFAFLVVIVLIYWRLEWRRQNALLLVASYFFYGWWDWRFLILILTSTVVDYHCARYIANSPDIGRRRALLALSLAVNIGFLGFFKYFNFFIGSAAALLDAVAIHHIPTAVLYIILPPGISFYTFQEVAYIVDVYHGKLKPANSLVEYALFITLFPHLIAGPIQRPSHLLPQVQAPRQFDGDRFFAGLMLIISGLFRKCVVADNCGLLADAAFGGRLGHFSLPVLCIGVYAFAWQIYGDFSGYSDIARGSAQLMGFHFMVNFRQPYLATSLQEFWQRWHISLSTWLRDYLYIPLGGNRHGERATYRNLMVTMLLGGLWHGANWTFVIWGAIHGMGLAVERFFSGIFSGRDQASRSGGLLSLAAWGKRILLFHLVCLTWIFFRAESVSDAFRLLGSIGGMQWSSEFTTAFKFLAVFALPLFMLDLALESWGEEYILATRPQVIQAAAGLLLFTLVTFFSANDVHAFLYFQF